MPDINYMGATFTVPWEWISYEDAFRVREGFVLPQEVRRSLYRRYIEALEAGVPPPTSLSEIEEPPEDTTNMKLVNNFRIGCDPEFLGFDSAGNQKNMAAVLGRNDKLGWDHSGAVGELRPSPCKSAHSLVKGLRSLILTPRLQESDIGKLRGGAYCEAPVPESGINRRINSLGGHIHLDVSPYVSQEERRDQTGGRFDPENLEPYNYAQFSREHGYRIRALDQLTDRLEQLDILPKEESEKRRNSTSYGRMGSFRVQNASSVASMIAGHPGARFEYRAMASWLIDPKVAFLALTGAKLIAAHPQESLEALGKERDSFLKFKWLYESFASHDIDAKRAMAILEWGSKKVRVDPDSDFRSRWSDEGGYPWR